MNSKLLALGAQKRFQGERERRTNQVSRSQIGRSDVTSLALFGPWFSCLLAHVFRPCMVLHKTRQHRSMSFFHSAKQLGKCSFISPTFLFFAAAQRNRILKFTGYRISFRWIQAMKEGCFLLCLINFHSQKVKLCGRTTRFSAGLHCHDQKGTGQC
jgi:hypothetical protein